MSRERVVRVDQSPMNPQRWVLELACGHDLWVTSKSRPKRKDADCPRPNCPGEASR